MEKSTISRIQVLLAFYLTLRDEFHYVIEPQMIILTHFLKLHCITYNEELFYESMFTTLCIL